MIQVLRCESTGEQCWHVCCGDPFGHRSDIPTTPKTRYGGTMETPRTFLLPSAHGIRDHARVLFRDLARDRGLYLLLLPGLALILLFCYVPMYGVSIAFQEFSIFKGFQDSPWVGLLQFERLFRTPSFPYVIRNTLLISLYKLLFGFPAPIVLALLLNEMRSTFYKRFTQTILYLPYFISWVIMAGLIRPF